MAREPCWESLTVALAVRERRRLAMTAGEGKKQPRGTCLVSYRVYSKYSRKHP